jgi:hypothetical protein
MKIKIIVLCDFWTPTAAAEVMKDVFQKGPDNYSEYIEFVSDYSFTHAIVLNTYMPKLNIPKENIYISNTSESYIPGILIKTIQTMDFVNKNFVYKHILRTNLSSFFILENLLKTCYKLPDTNLYAGIIGNHSNILFASGAGYWMSKDIVEKIIANKNNIDYNTLDDVAIGKLLHSIRITPLPRYDLDKNIPYDAEEKSIILNEIIANNHYHIRVKNTDNNINIDIMTRFFK